MRKAVRERCSMCIMVFIRDARFRRLVGRDSDLSTLLVCSSIPTFSQQNSATTFRCCGPTTCSRKSMPARRIILSQFQHSLALLVTEPFLLLFVDMICITKFQCHDRFFCCCYDARHKQPRPSFLPGFRSTSRWCVESLRLLRQFHVSPAPRSAFFF